MQERPPYGVGSFAALRMTAINAVCAVVDPA
jgi:hypothetical protein